MNAGQRLFAGIVALAVGPVIVPSVLSGNAGLAVLAVVFLFGGAMLGSLILSLGFDVARWRDGGYGAGVALAVVAAAAISLIFGPGAWDPLDLPGIVRGAIESGRSGGFGALLWPAVWNAGVLMIGMFILALPIFLVGKLLLGGPARKPPTGEPPRAV